LQQIALTRVEVDGYKLTDDELLDFASAYEDEYMETLEWIALSSIDSAATLPC
jgi:predicted membrane-bound spermidine synthase